MILRTFRHEVNILCHYSKETRIRQNQIYGTKTHPYDEETDYCAKMTSASISVSPNDALVDVKLKIQATGLSPFHKVTIIASVKERHLHFISYGHFMADDKGEVDVSRQSSTGGTYTGIRAMGLIWSMVAAPGKEKRVRYYKKDVTTPAVVEFTLVDSHVSWDQISVERTKLLARCEAKRWHKAKSVKREVIKTGLVRGVLFTPEGSGTFPGVIDVFGAIGGLLEFRAALLASRGFTVFAMPLFGYDDIPNSMSATSLEYLKETAKWLSEQPSVIPGEVGVLGVSRGGSVCQLMAIHCPEVKAVVNINGPPFIFYVGVQSKDEDIPVTGFDADSLISTPEGDIVKDVYKPLESDHLQAWSRDVPFLCILGEDDQCLNPSYNEHYYNMIPADKRNTFTIVKYKGAGHLIEPPYSPFTRTSYEKNMSGFTVWGGNAQEHSFAQEDSWLKIQAFFKHHLKNRRKYMKHKL